MSEGMDQNDQVERATVVLAASLEHMVQGQQLNIHTAAVGAALPQRPPSQAHSRGRSMPQRATLAGRHTSASRAPAKKAPSIVAKEVAREVFRQHVRPLQQAWLPDGSADAGAGKLEVCWGSSWQACKEENCGCQQQCAALRRKD